MWEPAISGMEKAHDCACPKLQAYPPIFSLTPKASGSTRLQSCEDKVFNSQIIQQYVFLLQKMLVCARICVTQKGEENV